ncbi:MAG: MFS transporter, partial [Proteobacteria bacterium]
MNQIQRNKIYLMIGTGGLISLAFFLTIPLIGLYAIDQFRVSTSQAGLLSSIWPATVFVCSFFVGRVADRWGYFKSMKLGNVICTVAFALMASTSSISVYIATLILFGIGKSLNESSMRAAIASMSPPDELARFMRLRYVLINIVCVGGPFLGFVSYKAFSSWAFAFSGLLYGLVFMILS